MKLILLRIIELVQLTSFLFRFFDTRLDPCLTSENYCVNGKHRAQTKQSNLSSSVVENGKSFV